MDILNEHSRAKLTITFKDEDGALIVPSSGTYRITDIFSGTKVKGNTDFTSGSSYTITISESENAILDEGRNYEDRRVTVLWKLTGDIVGTAEFVYRIKNLNQIPLPISTSPSVSPSPSP